MFKNISKMRPVRFAAAGTMSLPVSSLATAPSGFGKKTTVAPGTDKMLQSYCQQIVAQSASPGYQPAPLWLKLPH
jgi:hypothetical protein